MSGGRPGLCGRVTTDLSTFLPYLLHMLGWQSMAYVETAEWARVVVCPHVKHLEPCVAMSDCQELLRSKVDGGKVRVLRASVTFIAPYGWTYSERGVWQDLLRCYRACTGRTAPAEDVDWGQ